MRNDICSEEIMFIAQFELMMLVLFIGHTNMHTHHAIVVRLWSFVSIFAYMQMF